MTTWTDLDEAYLTIFDTHPDLVSVPPSTVSAMSSQTTEQLVDEHQVDEQGLTETEQQILDLERSWWKYAGAKESTVRELFGFGSTRYYQVLNVLIDKPAALEYDPMLVRRLQRLRTARRVQRSGRGG